MQNVFYHCSWLVMWCEGKIPLIHSYAHNQNVEVDCFGTQEVPHYYCGQWLLSLPPLA